MSTHIKKKKRSLSTKASKKPATKAKSVHTPELETMFDLLLKLFVDLDDFYHERVGHHLAAVGGTTTKVKNAKLTRLLLRDEVTGEPIYGRTLGRIDA